MFSTYFLGVPLYTTHLPHSFIMATTTVTIAPPAKHNLAEFKHSVGQYKEAAFGGPKVYQSEIELQGNEKHAAAKYPNYLPVWDNEKDIGKYVTIRFALLRGTFSCSIYLLA